MSFFSVPSFVAVPGRQASLFEHFGWTNCLAQPVGTSLALPVMEMPFCKRIKTSESYLTIVEFFHALSDRYTYALRQNHYIVFGIAWGLPVPVFSVGIHLYAQQLEWTVSNIWSTLADHPVHLFFLLHPLLFGAVFGALGTLRRIRDQRIAQVEREAIQTEIDIAQEVQTHLFPSSQPEMKTLDYFGMCRPANGLSGDYYDFVALNANQVCIALGDISGKGISAALLMASLQALVRSHTPFSGHSLESLVATMNRLMFSCTAETRYATLFCGVYDDSQRTLTYVNAGHNPPMLFRNMQSTADLVDKDTHKELLLNTVKTDQILRLQPSGAPLGMFRDMAYQQQSTSLHPGELLVIFTDGITEAVNENDQEFGESSLATLVNKHRGLSPAALINTIFTELDTFAGEFEQDDRTLIVVKVL